MSIIGAKIQITREARGLSRSELAKEIGCPYREILRWETTDQEPKASTLKKIADALNVSMDYLAAEDEFSEALSRKDPCYEKYTFHVFIRKNV